MRSLLRSHAGESRQKDAISLLVCGPRHAPDVLRAVVQPDHAGGGLGDYAGDVAAWAYHAAGARHDHRAQRSICRGGERHRTRAHARRSQGQAAGGLSLFCS